MAMKIISVTDIEGFRLGNAESREKGTGCTVIICEDGAVGGVDVRGGGPATRETDLLRSENTVNAVNAVVLSGGSAFGLEAASGVMRELSERNIGFSVGDDIRIPIVCGASLFDLPVGDPKAFPGIFMGVQAVRNAYAGNFANGNHGAGTGATVGKLKGYERAMKAGLGTFACGDGIVEVGAIAAVNAVGDIYNGAGRIIAGLRSEDGKSIYGTIRTLKGMVHDEVSAVEEPASFISRNDLDEALAAAARQYEEEKAASDEKPEPFAAEDTADAAAEDFAPVMPAVEPAEELAPETPAEEPAEAPAEELASETPAEEPAETAAEEPAEAAAEDLAPETSVEEPAEAAAEELAPEMSAEEPAEEKEEEFIPETPSAEHAAELHIGYDEFSIPAMSAEPVTYKDPAAAVSDLHTEEDPHAESCNDAAGDELTEAETERIAEDISEFKSEAKRS